MMQYRKLGQTDIDVSAVCLGTMTWGEQNTEAEAYRQMDIALDYGINFFDTAEMYPVPPMGKTQGRTESYIGNWFKQSNNRDKVILATKIAGPGEWMKHIRNGPKLTKEQVDQAVETSLQRLQTDYIDLYQIHWPSRATNFFGQLGFNANADLSQGTALEETIAALGPHLKAGRIRHWGLSNETPWGTMQALKIAESLGIPAPVSIQNPYNLLNRVYEVGMAEVSMRESTGLLAYSPLAFGVLTGKYLNGQWPEKGRLTLYKRFQRYTSEIAETATQAYVDLAAERGFTPVQLALGFVTQQAFVTSNIIGATTEEQLHSCIKGALTEIDQDTLAAIEKIHQQHSNPCP